MLKNTFLMFEGIGKRKEQRLWHSGVHDWDDFRVHLENSPLPNRNRLCKQLAETGNALVAMDSTFFGNVLPKAEMWRIYTRFKDEAVYLDIETTGIKGVITVIGLYDGNNSRCLVRGINLSRDALKRALFGAKMIVTFNGACFDLPAIEREYPGIIQVPHIDIRTVCSRCGFFGGLKQIEKQLGILRNEPIDRLHGGDAALLWRYYQATGDRHYLDLLLEYNESDTVNLEKIAETACSMLERAMKQEHFILGPTSL